MTSTIFLFTCDILEHQHVIQLHFLFGHTSVIFLEILYCLALVFASLYSHLLVLCNLAYLSSTYISVLSTLVVASISLTLILLPLMYSSWWICVIFLLRHSWDFIAWFFLFRQSCVCKVLPLSCDFRCVIYYLNRLFHVIGFSPRTDCCMQILMMRETVQPEYAVV